MGHMGTAARAGTSSPGKMTLFRAAQLSITRKMNAAFRGAQVRIGSSLVPVRADASTIGALCGMMLANLPFVDSDYF